MRLWVLLLLVLTRPAMACWCHPPSLRQLMAAEQVAVIEMVEVVPERPMSVSEAPLTSQRGYAEVREVLAGGDLHPGYRVPVQQSYGQGPSDGCGPAVLSSGDRFLVPLRLGQLQSPLGGCFNGTHDASSPVTYRLSREFESRRQMTDEDWQSLLAPLLEALQPKRDWADGCLSLLGSAEEGAVPSARFTRKARNCALGLSLTPGGGWMVAEDVRSDRLILYAAASDGLGPSLVLMAPIEVSAAGHLSLSPQHIQPASCAQMAADLRVDAKGFCRSDRSQD